MRGMARLFLLLMCCGTQAAWAQADNVAPPAETTGVEAEADEQLDFLDPTRNYLSTEFVDMVKGIDRFFGDERNFQESNDSVLQLDITRATGYGGNRQIVLDGRANVHLPNTENKLHLLIESNPDRNLTSTPASKPLPVVSQVDTPNSFAAALRYIPFQLNRWQFSTDGGIKFQGLNSHLFARSRATYTANYEQWQLKFLSSPFWFNNLGLGFANQYDIDRAISEPLLFRSSSNATWYHDRQNTELSQSFLLFQTLDERSALLYQATAIGASRPAFHSIDYILSTSYRYRLHQKWMYLDISPQMHYPQARAYRPSYAMMIRLEILFGGDK